MTAPFGILLIMVAMWMLSGSTSESGTDDMMAAILLRGLGLGFLFLSITLIAFCNSITVTARPALVSSMRSLGGSSQGRGNRAPAIHMVPIPACQGMQQAINPPRPLSRLRDRAAASSHPVFQMQEKLAAAKSAYQRRQKHDRREQQRRHAR